MNMIKHYGSHVRAFPHMAPSTQLGADARALWAVRVLWAHALQRNVDVPTPKPRKLGWWAIVIALRSDGGGYGEVVDYQDLERATPEECCIAAADAVWPELPAEARAKIGARP